MLKLALPALCTLLLTTPALAFVPWGNPNGSGSFFTWSDGGSDNGRFECHTLLGGDTFVLSTNFSMLADPGQTRFQSDRMQVDLHAYEGFRFDRILFHETIHYTITGDANTAELDLTHFALDLGDAGRLVTATTSPTIPLAGSGVFTISGVIDLSEAPDWTNLHLVFNQNMLAQAGPNGSVQLDATLLTFQVPAPAPILTLAPGLLLPRRRR